MIAHVIHGRLHEPLSNALPPELGGHSQNAEVRHVGAHERDGTDSVQLTYALTKNHAPKLCCKTQTPDSSYELYTGQERLNRRIL